MNYERKVDSMDSLAGTQSYYEEADNRRKRTRLIIAVVLIALALHRWARKLVRRVLMERYPYGFSVFTQTRNLTRLALLILAMIVAIPVAPLQPETAAFLARAKRTRIGIVLETGEAREVHHHCLLVGYGADGINPYLAFEALWQSVEDGHLDADTDVVGDYRLAVAKGMLKVLAKMGISTMQSYKGAQIFEALGLADEVIDLLQGGQGVFGIAIGGVWREIEGTLAELPSERTAEPDAQSDAGPSAGDELAARRAARKIG